MVGNDVIDLDLASQSNWQRKGFLEKVYTPVEQQNIYNSVTPFRLVWLFWSMKESAYKIYIQQGGKRIFAPLKFECFLEEEFKGSVYFENKKYPTCSTFTKKYIHTISYISLFKGFNDLIYFTNTSAKNQSREVYAHLKKIISAQKKINSNCLEIVKTPLGVPQLYYENKVLEISFSLSHHGSYGAVAIS